MTGRLTAPPEVDDRDVGPDGTPHAVVTAQAHSRAWLLPCQSGLSSRWRSDKCWSLRSRLEGALADRWSAPVPGPARATSQCEVWLRPIVPHVRRTKSPRTRFLVVHVSSRLQAPRHRPGRCSLTFPKARQSPTQRRTVRWRERSLGDDDITAFGKVPCESRPPPRVPPRQSRPQTCGEPSSTTDRRIALSCISEIRGSRFSAGDRHFRPDTTKPNPTPDTVLY